MKKILATFIASTATIGAFAQDVAQAATQTIDTAAAEGASIHNYIIIAAVALIIGAMVIHMIYEHLRDNLNTEYTVADFGKKRKELALSNMTAQEVADYNRRIDEVMATWDAIYNEYGQAIPYPFKRSAVMNMWHLSKEITAANPTDKRLVERINEINEILNHALRRQFSGSKAMIIIAIIVAIICGLITNSLIPPACIGAGALLYLLTSRSATFLIAAKQAESNGSTNLLSGIVSGLFIGAVAVKTNKSQSWTQVILAIVVMLFGASALAIISVVNYIRNYLIYR